MSQQLQSDLAKRDDELDLAGLLKILALYKRFIFSFVAATILSGVVYVLNAPNVYKVQALMLPVSLDGVNNGSYSDEISGLASMVGISIGNNSSSAGGNQALATLMTKNFLNDFIQESSLKPVLFSGQWNKKDKSWVEKEPSNLSAARLLLDMLDIFVDPKDKTMKVELSLKWKNPNDTAKMADILNNLINYLNISEKKRVLFESKRNISFLEKELEKTDILEFKVMLYGLIEHEVSNTMLANVRDDFVFRVIDPATKPIQPESDKKALIIVLSIVLGFFLSSFISVIHNSLRRP